MDTTRTYPEGIDTISTELVRGDLEASNGHIGQIDETSMESGGGDLVVDAGCWILEGKRPLRMTRTRSSMPLIGIR